MKLLQNLCPFQSDDFFLQEMGGALTLKRNNLMCPSPVSSVDIFFGFLARSLNGFRAVLNATSLAPENLSPGKDKSAEINTCGQIDSGDKSSVVSLIFVGPFDTCSRSRVSVRRRIQSRKLHPINNLGSRQNGSPSASL